VRAPEDDDVGSCVDDGGEVPVDERPDVISMLDSSGKPRASLFNDLDTLGMLPDE